ncbi:MAG: Mov34/MPN/PAD-1 family protein [Alphaproteobacteria bacterium]|nr:Mov34/MPN/PAD-1 family protein [Alphaproteobacteria bacterium]
MQFTNNADITITFENEVLELFEKHKQLSEKSLEAGGQLFARFNKKEVIISKATGLRDGDKRGRFLFWPNRKKEQNEIKELFGEGYHYVGDWHTHPEIIPTPSKTDLKNIAECYTQSKHDLKYFIMVIIGTDGFPNGMHVSAHNSDQTIKLNFLPVHEVNVSQFL